VLTVPDVSVNTENTITKERLVMKLNLTITAKKIEIYYDGKCGMCCRFIEWLVAQDRAMEVVCLPYQSEEATKNFPEIESHNPAKEIVVRVDGGEIYTGAEGWVWCLWSGVKYRDVAKLMNSRWMLPVAKKACVLISKNRLKVSKLFFGKKAKQIADEIHKVEVAKEDCDSDNCRL